ACPERVAPSFRRGRPTLTIRECRPCSSQSCSSPPSASPASHSGSSARFSSFHCYSWRSRTRSWSGLCCSPSGSSRRTTRREIRPRSEAWQDVLRKESPRVAGVARAPPRDGARDLAGLLQEAQRQAAHPVQRRGGGGAVLRLGRQHLETD